MTMRYRDIAPLLIGISIFGLGAGLHATLLAVRITSEGFTTEVAGVIMSMYFVGFVIGSHYIPRLIGKVGHIRVFTALSATTSAAVLLFNVFVDPIAWSVLRLIIGIAGSGIYIVAETWLNDVATSDNRGKLLGIYTFVLLNSVLIGQFLLKFVEGNGNNLFILISVLTSVAAIPLALFAHHSPAIEEVDIMPVPKLFTYSPIGVIAAVVGGVGFATLTAFGAVYVAMMGKSNIEISTYVACAMAGGAVLQWPFGALSDKYGRRAMIFIAAVVAVVVNYILIIYASENWITLLVGTFILGGVGLSLYILSLSLINDRLEKSQMVSAGGSMILLEGIGSSIGPMAASMSVASFGLAGFYYVPLVTSFGLAAMVLYRMIFMPKEYVPAAFPNMVSKTSAISVQLASEVAEDAASDNRNDEPIL